jgi:hypothetical protein
MHTLGWDLKSLRCTIKTKAKTLWFSVILKHYFYDCHYKLGLKNNYLFPYFYPHRLATHH